jgi:hypothetical protein
VISADILPVGTASLEPFSEIDSRPPINPSPSIWLLLEAKISASSAM